MIKQVTILGATGSIGRSTLNVIAAHPEKFKVYALTGHRNLKALLALAITYEPVWVVVDQVTDAELMRAWLKEHQLTTRVTYGVSGLCDVVCADDVDIVMSAIVGAAGLAPTIAAARAGKKLLLANKESLVVAGQLLLDAVKLGHATLLPIDSEHNAIFQCLDQSKQNARSIEVKRLILTASGGPFRMHSQEALQQVTPEEACKHPNWSMGQKISVDSASLMNKGLEVIEAFWLFGLPLEKIAVVVHPQSVIHSMVEYIDGSVLAQLGQADMRTPIAYGLAWPQRIEAGVSSLDFLTVGQLTFESPDLERFQCLRLAYEAIRIGGTAPTVLNAANEIAVTAFLQRSIRFVDIPNIIDAVLTLHQVESVQTLDQLSEVDQWARHASKKEVARYGFNGV